MTWRFNTLSTKYGTVARGRAEKLPKEVIFFSTATLVPPPKPGIQKFYPQGTFSTLTLHCPPLSHKPPPIPPPLRPPPPPLLRRLLRISMEAAPATMARRGQSHAPNPEADSWSAGFPTPPPHPPPRSVQVWRTHNCICCTRRFNTKPLSHPWMLASLALCCRVRFMVNGRRNTLEEDMESGKGN